jgi:hypothetical protein
MAAMTDYLENKLIDWLFRGQTYTPPATPYVGLLTAAPSDTGGGTEVSTSATNYARVGVAASLANWAGTSVNTGGSVSSGTNGTTSNVSAITFGVPSAAWGTITHVGIYDAASGGNLLAYAALTASKTVNNGDPAPSFAANALTFQIDT